MPLDEHVFSPSKKPFAVTKTSQDDSKSEDNGPFEQIMWILNIKIPLVFHQLWCYSVTPFPLSATTQSQRTLVADRLGSEDSQQAC